MSNAARVFGTEVGDTATLHRKVKRDGKPGRVYRESVEDQLQQQLLILAKDDLVTTAASIQSGKGIEIPLTVWEQDVYFTLDTYYRNQNLTLNDSNGLTFYLSVNSGSSDPATIIISQPLDQVVELEILDSIIFPNIKLINDFTTVYYPTTYFGFKEVTLLIRELITQSIACPGGNYHFSFYVKDVPPMISGAPSNDAIVQLVPKNYKFTFSQPINLTKMTLQFQCPEYPIRFPVEDYMYVYLYYNGGSAAAQIKTIAPDEYDPITDTYNAVSSGLATQEYISFEDFAVPNLVNVNDASQPTYKTNTFQITAITGAYATLDYTFPTAIATSIDRPADPTLGTVKPNLSLTLVLNAGHIEFRATQYTGIVTGDNVTIHNFSFTDDSVYELADLMLGSYRTISTVLAGPSRLTLDINTQLYAQDSYSYHATSATGYRSRLLNVGITYSFVLSSAVFGTAVAHGLRPGDSVRFMSFNGLNRATVTAILTAHTITHVDSETTFRIDYSESLYSQYISNPTSAGTAATFYKHTSEIALTVTYVGGNVIFTTSSAHGLNPGDPMTISWCDTTSSAVLASLLTSRTVLATPAADTFTLDNNAALWLDHSMANATWSKIINYNFTLTYAPSTVTFTSATTFNDVIPTDVMTFSAFNQSTASAEALEAAINGRPFAATKIDNTTFYLTNEDADLVAEQAANCYFPTTCTSVTGYNQSRMNYVKIYVCGRRIRVPFRARTITTQDSNGLTPATF